MINRAEKSGNMLFKSINSMTNDLLLQCGHPSHTQLLHALYSLSAFYGNKDNSEKMDKVLLLLAPPPPKKTHNILLKCNIIFSINTHFIFFTNKYL